MKRFGVSARWAVVCFDCAVMLAGCGGGGGSSSSGGGGESTPPSILSFTAASAEIIAGGSTTLTASFSNGTGVITPGNLPVTSGTPVSVTPSTTTTYTLTVSGSGSPATQTLTVKVDPLPVISSFSANNNNSSLYGWQNKWGAFNVFSDADTDCPGEGPIGTMSPTAQAFNLFQNVAVTGETVLTATVEGDTTNVRAYAATHTPGTALVLFNLNETAAETVVITLTGQSSSSNVQVMTYDKQMYDYTNTNCAPDPSCSYDATHDYSNPQWVGPATTTLSGTQTLPLTLTLQPWSMNVVLVQ